MTCHFVSNLLICQRQGHLPSCIKPYKIFIINQICLNRIPVLVKMWLLSLWLFAYLLLVRRMWEQILEIAGEANICFSPNHNHVESSTICFLVSLFLCYFCYYLFVIFYFLFCSLFLCLFVSLKPQSCAELYNGQTFYNPPLKRAF